MRKIILEINEALKKQGISETKAANMAGLPQVKVNRMLKGETKKIDYDAVNKLREVLGLTVQESGMEWQGQICIPDTDPLAILYKYRKEHPDIADKAIQEAIAHVQEGKRSEDLVKKLEELQEEVERLKAG